MGRRGPWCRASAIAKRSLSRGCSDHESDNRPPGQVPGCGRAASALHLRAGAHAFLLDTAVDPDRQRSGIGARLVRAIVDETTAAGCDWLHVDYVPHLRLVLHRGMRVQLDLRGPPQTHVWVSPILINRCRRKQSDTVPVGSLRAAADSAHSRAFNPSRRSHLTLPMNRTVQMTMNTSHKAKYQ